MSDALLTCIPKALPKSEWVAAARTAVDANPLNFPPLQNMKRLMPDFVPTPEHIAVVTTKYWGSRGVKLSVGFLDNPERALRKKILAHMNAWAKAANVSFKETKNVRDADVRILREGGAQGGYWSYVGTDIRHIPRDQQTMNLEAFTLDTPDSEFYRVIRHETGHTLGFPHEHMRRELIERIDEAKAIAWFGETQGWPPDEVRAQVLTPIEEASILGTEHADPNSIMCYQIPGALTKDGKPIAGGTDIDPSDYAFATRVYPKPTRRRRYLIEALPASEVAQGAGMGA